MPEKTLTLTLPVDAMEWIRSQVQSGHFASSDEAIRAGILLLQEEWEFEQSMHIEEVTQAVAESYDEVKRHPESLIPAEEVIRNMEERHRTRLKQAS